MRWPLVPLGAIAEIVGGSTPSRDDAEYWGGSIPWVTPTDLPMPGKGIATLKDTAERITEQGLASSAANLLPVGTVLFSSRATIGKLAITEVPLATNQGFANFIPGKLAVYNRYLAWALQFHTPNIERLAGSTTFKEVTKTALRAFRIPLPPLSEQRRIVEVLDEADRLRKLRCQADAKAARILPSLFHKIFGDPVTNALKWPLHPIGDLVRPIERRDPSLHPDKEFIYVDIAGVDGANGEILETKRLLGRDAPSRARQIVRTNDILVSTVRPYLKATALVPESLDNQIASTGFCVLRSKVNFGHGYLYALTRLQWFTEQLNARARGASYPAVTDSDILRLRIPPPTNEAAMREFDRQVNELLRISHDRAQARERLETSFSSLLSQAFSGQLTASWREARAKELLAEMEQQARQLNLPPRNVERLATQA